jgi:hypothetical protein
MTAVSTASAAVVDNVDGRRTGDITLGRDTLRISFDFIASGHLLKGRSCVTSRPCSNQSFELQIALQVSDIELSLLPEEPESCRTTPLPMATDWTEHSESYPLSALLNGLETIDSRQELSERDEGSDVGGKRRSEEWVCICVTSIAVERMLPRPPLLHEMCAAAVFV